MTTDNNKIIGGAGKGKGGGGDTYTEEPDNLFSYSEIKITDLICEGEIEGFAKADPLKCIYFDGVPIRNNNENDFNGPVNFARVGIDLKYGTADQETIDSASEISRSVGISKRIYHSLPEGIHHTVNDKNVTKVRIGIRVNRLQEQELGETVTVKGYRVSFAIYLNGVLYSEYTIQGKTSSGYVKEYEIPLGNMVTENGFVTIKIVKTSKDSTSNLISEDLIWDYVNEIIETRLNYPYSAICAIKVDSKSFSQLPRRQYHLKFIKVKLPSNYDPLTRTYNGNWDGTFSEPKWTDNPAWILYDILTNRRYGFGDEILCKSQDFTDIWTLYEISKYCDELVPSGKKDSNGDNILEPRFTCSVAIYDKQKITDVVNQFCSIFRGMPIWYSNKITFAQDRPRSSSSIFTNANVSKEGFSYTSSNYMQRYSVAIVYFADKTDYYEKNLVYIEDPEAIKRIGYKEIEIDAFGCVSRSQAMRIGKWAIYSSFFESELVTFKTGFDALSVSVGDVISVFDNERFLVRRSGRIKSCNLDRNILELDGQVYIDPSKESRIHVVIPKGKRNIFELTDSSQISDTNIAQFETVTIVPEFDTGYYTDKINLQSSLSTVVDLNCAYIVESKSFDDAEYFYQNQNEFNELLLNMQKNFSTDLKAVDLYQSKPKEYRVVGMKDNGDASYDITALEYFPEKYSNIENDLVVQTTVIQPPSSNWKPAPPYNLNISKTYKEPLNSVTVSWNHSADKNKYGEEVSYDCYYVYYDSVGQNRVFIGNTKESNISFLIPNGFYIFLISTKIQGVTFPTAVYSMEISKNIGFGSLWQNGFSYDNDLDFNLDNLYVDGLRLSNGDTINKFSSKDASFSWELSDYSILQEIKGFGISVYSTGGSIIGSGSVLRQDNSAFNYTLDLVKNSNFDGGPYRNFGIRVGITDYSNFQSGFSPMLYVNNPAPKKPTYGVDYTLEGGNNKITLKQPWISSQFFQTGKAAKSDGYDVVGTMIYYSTGVFTATGDIDSMGMPTSSMINYYDATASPQTDILTNKGNYYVMISNYDTFGKKDLNYSDVHTVSVLGSSDVAPNPPSSLSLSSNLISGSNGYLNIRLSGVWNPSLSSDVALYSFEIKKLGESDYQSYITNKNYYYVGDIQPLTTYHIKVGAISSLGLVSNYISGTHTVAAYNLSQNSVASVPVGGMITLANGIIPPSQSGTFVLCDGRYYDTGTYPEFFDRYGYLYGEDNVTGFRVPSGQYNPQFPFVIRIA